MQFIALSLLLLVSCFSQKIFSAEEIVDKATGVTFPSTIAFDYEGKQYTLNATGVATRKKFFVKVYSVASYLQQPLANPSSDLFQAILQSENAKQLTIKWIHEASVEKIQDGYRESFKNVLSDAQNAQFQNDLNTFVKFFNQDAQKGDEHILRWLPGGYVEVVINGKKIGSLNSVEFAKALWGLWFGDKSVVDRNQLVSFLK